MRYMHHLSMVLGTLGGIVGAGIHAVLLARFFSQSHGLFQIFLELLLCVVLGLAAVAIATVSRHSPKTLAIYLPLFAVLGLFPQLLTWIPAAVLLVGGGVAAFMAQRHARDADTTTRPGALITSDGTPLHWSEAARLGIAAAPAQRAAKPDPRPWSCGHKLAVAGGALAVAAVVIPLSVGTVTLDQEHTHSATSTTVSVVHSAGAAPATTSSSTTTVPICNEEFAWYTDERYGFTIKFPVAWRNTDPTEVGQRMYRQVAKTYTETFVPAAFADWSSPTFNGCYLDYIWIEVYDKAFADVPTLPEFGTVIQDRLERLASEYAGLKRVEPLEDLVLSGMQGVRHMWSVPYGGHTLMLMECVLATEGRAYFLQFAAVEEDWDAYSPVFEEILGDFSVSGTGPVG